MKSNANKTTKQWMRVVIGVLALAALALVVVQLKTRNSVSAKGTQITFPSSAEAGAALAKAAKSDDETAVAEILGLDTKVLLSAGDKEADKAALETFASKYEKMNRWVDMTDGSRVLYIGADNFAFPVPLTSNSSRQWYFDAVAGAEEIRARDIGRNELLTIDACSALARAQEVYFVAGGDSAEFAQRIISTSGKQDGLYWAASEQQVSSPLANIGEFAGPSLTALYPNEPLIIDGYEWLTFNPISRVRTSSKRLRDKDILTPDEFQRLAEQLSVRDRAMVLLAGSTGLRRSEMIALTWSDLDTRTMEVTVLRSCVRNRFGNTKTESSRRPVPLHPIVLNALLDWRTESPYATDADFLFPSIRLKGDKPLSPDSLLEKNIRPALVRAGIVGKQIGWTASAIRWRRICEHWGSTSK